MAVKNLSCVLATDCRTSNGISRHVTACNGTLLWQPMMYYEILRTFPRYVAARRDGFRHVRSMSRHVAALSTVEVRSVSEEEPGGHRTRPPVVSHERPHGTCHGIPRHAALSRDPYDSTVFSKVGDVLPSS